MSETTWTHLLGLPLDQAAAHLSAGGAAYRIVATSAPQRDGAKGCASEGETAPIPVTQRVIRVRKVAGEVELVVSGFPDGDPKQA